MYQREENWGWVAYPSPKFGVCSAFQDMITLSPLQMRSMLQTTRVSTIKIAAPVMKCFAWCLQFKCYFNLVQIDTPPDLEHSSVFYMICATRSDSSCDRFLGEEFAMKLAIYKNITFFMRSYARNCSKHLNNFEENSTFSRQGWNHASRELDFHRDYQTYKTSSTEFHFLDNRKEIST